MTEALAAMLGRVFRNVGLHRISATVFLDNPASAGVLRKLGFRHEARLRHTLRKAGRYRDADQYGLLATDLAARRLGRRGAPCAARAAAHRMAHAGLADGVGSGAQELGRCPVFEQPSQ